MTDLGLWVAGGKGQTSRRTPQEIASACERTGGDGEALARASKLAAKVDNTALQSGHQLYHHSFFLTASGSWAVVQQGMRYGTPASTRDPARFAFAHGGKDGTPYAVDRETYDKTVDVMTRALSGSDVARSERVAALKRLTRLAPAA